MTHLQSYSAEYQAFHDAKQRCNNSKHKRYLDWGGRGIQFNFTSFKQFISHIGTKPETTYVLDRINNDGNYEINNVRWVSRNISQLNRRIGKNNKIGITGVRQVRAKGLITKTYQAYCQEQGKFKQLYTGPSYIDACSARLSWEKNYDH